MARRRKRSPKTTASWQPWNGNGSQTDRVASHHKWGIFYRHESTGLWWSKDQTQHGGSNWKVFRESSGGLIWTSDADEFGNFIVEKHKSETGKFVPWGELSIR